MKLVAVLLLTLAGCRCAGGGDVREVTEVGVACLTGNGEVRVGFGGCLSSTCDRVLRTSCTAHREGTAVVVKGSASIEHFGEECAKDCKAAIAVCAGEPIDDPAGLSVNATQTPKLTRCWDAL